MVLPSLEDPVSLEVFEARCEEIARDPEVLDELVESVPADGHVSDDEGRPPVTHDLQALGKRAMELGEAGLAHVTMIGQLLH